MVSVVDMASQFVGQQNKASKMFKILYNASCLYAKILKLSWKCCYKSSLHETKKSTLRWYKTNQTKRRKACKIGKKQNGAYSAQKYKYFKTKKKHVYLNEIDDGLEINGSIFN